MTSLPHSLIAAARKSAVVVSVPMRVPFRGVTHREALLFEGPAGWAEWGPFLEYPDAEAATWLAGALDFAASTPKLSHSQIGINATLPAVAPADVAGVLAPYGDFHTVKIKVAEAGQKMADDLARIRQVRELYPEAKIRLDANGAYSVGNAMQLGHRLKHAGIAIEYFEQPVATLEEMTKLKPSLNEVGIRVAADELVRKASDPLAVARAGAADLLVIKAAPLGGISRALEIVAEAGLPAVVSSALETSVGISMGLYLAGALPNLSMDCGLGTVALLADDVTDDSLIPVNGKLAVSRVTPSRERLERLAAVQERTDWWLARFDRCTQLL